MKKVFLLLGLIFLLTSMANANEAQDLLRKAREEYYKSIEGQEKEKKEVKEPKVKVEKETKPVYTDEAVKEEEPKPKTALEKLEYNSKKALEKVDYYERVVRSVAREEDELNGYKKIVKNKK